MDFKNFQALSAACDDLLWFVESFLVSNNGMDWKDVGNRRYFSTGWMDFFSGLHDGTFEGLVKRLVESQLERADSTALGMRLVPAIESLQSLELKRENQRARMKLEVNKFERYEEKLKEMSRKNIIFDIIRDDEDIRDTYFIDFSPLEVRDYMVRNLQWILDSFESSQAKKIKELEDRQLELENELREKNTLLKLANDRQRVLGDTAENNRRDLEDARKTIESLEQVLSRYRDEEPTDETESNDIKEDSKLRMYYLYKLGFLDDSIWNADIPQKVRAQIIGTLLDAGPLKSGTAIRYYKFFNSTGSAELKGYDSRKEPRFLDYMRKLCPEVEFKKGGVINKLRKI